MRYVVDVVRGDIAERFVASHPAALIPLLTDEERRTDQADFLVRIEKVPALEVAERRADKLAATRAKG